jgi:hypothetical protein
VSTASIIASATVTCSRAHAGSGWAASHPSPLPGHQVASLRAAVVVEHRLDALLPLAALRRERVPQPDPRAQIQNVIGRNPRLGQPSDHQQLA